MRSEPRRISPRSSTALLAAAVALAAPSVARADPRRVAEVTTLAQCHEVAAALGLRDPDPGPLGDTARSPDRCVDQLATNVAEALRVAFTSPPAPPATSTSQPVLSDVVSLQGGAADTNAVGSLLPPTSGGFGIGTAVRSDATSTHLLLGATLNPITLFSDTPVTRRLLAVGVQVPINLGSGAGSNGVRPDYVGVRVRLNLAPLLFGSAYASALDGAVEEARGATTRRASAHSDLRGAALEALRQSRDLDACARELAALGPGAHDATHCDADRVAAVVALARGLADVEPVVRQAFDRVRAATDRGFLGVDLRFDYGDPTLAGTGLTEDLSLGAHVAGGYRVPLVASMTRYLEVRLRAGFAGDRRAASGATFRGAFDGAVSASYNGVRDVHAISASLGLEARAGNVVNALTPGGPADYLALRAGLTIPLSATTGVGVSLAAPLTYAGPVLFGVSYDVADLARLLGADQRASERIHDAASQGR